ncbi:MAG: EAL domain-containing protein [Pseudomonadota bacterium]|nr:EAL domain-containing protein [Pseudomonadota bacterium]
MGSSVGQTTNVRPGWPVPDQETERLAELIGYHVGDGPEVDLTRIVELAGDVLDVPIAMINLAYGNHVQVKARIGTTAEQIPRELTCCSHTILCDDGLTVFDLREDERFENDALGPLRGVRFYAGVPLRTERGFNIGTLCVLDTEPRKDFSLKQHRLLKRLAALVMEKLELRRLQRTDVITSQFVNSTAEAFLCVGHDGIITYWNTAAERMFGLAPEQAIGRSIEIIVPERFRGAHAVGFNRVAKGGTSKLAGRPVELSALRANGEEFPVELLISVWQHENTRCMGAIMRDMSLRKEQERRLDYLAHHDHLTGLLNRYYFCVLVDETIVAGRQASILLIDIDGFRAVNDSFGNERGDTLLQSLAIRITACLDASMQFARIGGDDFAVLVMGDSAVAFELALAIQIAVAEPFDLNDQLVTLSISVGVSSVEAAGGSVRHLLAAADLALFNAKTEGQQHCRVFEPHMRERFVGRRELAHQLQAASAAREFVLYYQPQTDLGSGALIGCEALLRWHHPDRGLLFPGSFIDALQHAECSEEIGWWTLDEACRQLAAWDREGLYVPCVGVNLFAKQFRTADFAGRIVATLAAHGLTPGRLELELTETLALAQGDASLGLLNAVRSHGIGLAFDDFGTGFASLSTMKRIPLTRLKIDKSFVNDLDGVNHDTAVVRAVIGIARDLRLGVIAEGIETPEQAEQLRLLGCRGGQGFLFGRGLPPGEFAARYTLNVSQAL